MNQGYCSRIVGTGSHLPPRTVGNAEVARPVHLREEDVFQLTGIRARRWAGPHDECSQLAEEASRRALESAGLTTDSIDAILVSTTSPDTILPSTACHLQRRLGARNVAAFDVSASCSGFIYGLSMADCFIRSGQFNRCLVVASEIKSRYLDSENSACAILFGDGAGAAVVIREDIGKRREPPGILGVRLYADGTYSHLITVPAGGSRLPFSSDTVRNRLHTLQMKGGVLFRIAVKRLSQAVQDLLGEFDLRPADIKRVIAHQANGRMLAAIARRLQIPQGTMFSILEEYGNTSSASLPIALDFAHRQGIFNAGDLILLGAFGGGLTWGAALVRW